MGTEVFFKPWVGAQYSSGGIFGKKIMVLGESHYCGGCNHCGLDFNCECNIFTTKVVNDYLNQNNEREGWMNTYLKFERSLVGHETTPVDSQKIWDSIVFYNFLQVAMNGAREAGSNDQYEQAASPFISVLNTYQPDILVVWGIRLWRALPYTGWIDGPDFQVDNYAVNNGYYKLSNGKTVRAICVYHPSTGYSWDYWYKVISMTK